MPSSGLLKEFSGALVISEAGATVSIDGEPFAKYASFHPYVADVQDSVKSNPRFDLKQCVVQNQPEGHNKFNLLLVYFRPPDMDNGKIIKEYPGQPIGGKIMWKVVGE